MEKDLLLLYEEKSKYNDIESIISLADYYLENNEDSKSFALLRKFEYLEDSNGYRKLAYLYENGRGVDRNIDEAIKYYEKAYALGDISSGYNLALLYIREKQYEKSIPYLADGRYQGHLKSIRVLADLYRLGLGVSKNEDIAVNLYIEAVELGDTSLYDQIGSLYYQKQDYLSAFSYFEKGANLLDKNSLYHLGICYSKGQGTYLDMQKAIYYFELAVKQGDYRPLYNLSVIYEKGIGVSVDLDKSKKLLEKYENIKNLQK